MNARGIICLAVTVTALATGCTSADDGADELGDIREVVAEDAEEPGTEVGDEPPTDEGTEATEPEESASAEAPEDDEEPPEPSEVDITVVPDEITVEYVQAVVDELERIYAEALVLLMEEGELTIEVSDRVGEIFTVDQARVRTTELHSTMEEGFPGFLPATEVAANTWTVTQIHDASQECIWAEGTRTADGMLDEPPPATQTFVLLEFPEVERPVDINPTPWVIAALRIGGEEELREVDACA